MPLDTRYNVNTPEGGSLELSPAGPSVRFWAWFIDALIRLGLNISTFSIFGMTLGNTGFGIALILMFLIEWFYPVYFEVKKKGQTPGKKAVGIYVTQENGTPISLSASMIRNLLRFVDFLPFFYGFGLISMLLNRRFQRLGDLVAGTVVLYVDEKGQYDITDEAIDVEPIRPEVVFNLQEQQNLIRFAQRRSRLSPARAEELANTVGNCLDKDDKTTTDYLTGIAYWIQGKQSSLENKKQ